MAPATDTVTKVPHLSDVDREYASLDERRTALVAERERLQAAIHDALRGRAPAGGLFRGWRSAPNETSTGQSESRRMAEIDREIEALQLPIEDARRRAAAAVTAAIRDAYARQVREVAIALAERHEPELALLNVQRQIGAAGAPVAAPMFTTLANGLRPVVAWLAVAIADGFVRPEDLPPAAAYYAASHSPTSWWDGTR